MAVTLAQQVTAVATESFQYRVAMGMFAIAREVLFEGKSIEGHALRYNFATGVVNSDYMSFLKYAALVATDPVIVSAAPTSTDAITDATILASIRRMWNPLSGVS